MKEMAEVFESTVVSDLCDRRFAHSQLQGRVIKAGTIYVISRSVPSQRSHRAGNVFGRFPGQSKEFCHALTEMFRAANRLACVTKPIG